MELRVLQYFLAVAREQSISAAAQSLHLSQPTLSTQLKALEEEFGKRLFIRGTKGTRKVTLTEDGILLRKRAQEILSLVKKTEQELMVSNEGIAGDVYIGAGETDAVRLLAKVAGDLKQKYPEIHYHITSGNAFHILDQLDKGLLDFGLLYGPTDPAKYDRIKIPFQDTFGVLMRKDAPLAQKDFICPQDLWDQPLIITQQNEHGESAISEWIKRDISELNIVATYNLVFNASLFAREGLGYVIALDKLINTSGDSPLCFRPLHPLFYTTANVVWKKHLVLSKATKKFLECLQEYSEE